ncbi:TM2 domain-containing protein [Gemmiger sp.]
MSQFVTPTSHKHRRTALILCLLGGVLGLHRFYVGKWGTGFLYMITAGGFVLGWLFDLIKILRGKFTDSHGMPLIEW